MSAEEKKPQERIGVYVCHCGTNIAGVVNVGEVGKWASDNLTDAGRGHCTRLQVHVLQPGPGTDREGYQGTEADPRGGGSLLPAPARKDLPHCLQRRRSKPVPVRAGLHPRAGLVGAHRQGRRHRKGQGHDLGRRGTRDRITNRWNRCTSRSTRPRWSWAAASPASRRRSRSPMRASTVYLVEREPSIGGHMAQFDKTFPTLDCSACILTPKMVRRRQHIPTSPC